METWEIIDGYEQYQVSNKGNVISFYGRKARLLKQIKGSDGYFYVNLYHNRIPKQFKIHQLVAIAFLGHKPCGYKLVVNHVNFIKTDNRVENLQIVTSRENTNQKHLKSSSQYTGVHWRKKNKKWVASIYAENKTIYLGEFTNEIDASNSYQRALLNVKQTQNNGL